MGKNEQTLQIFDNLLFPKIFQTFRMAVQPSKLIIAFLSITIICLAGWFMDFSRTVVVTKAEKNIQSRTELDVYMDNPKLLKVYIENNKEKGQRNGVFNVMWHFAESKFQGVLNSMFAFNLPGVIGNITEYFKAIGWAVRYHLIYCLIFSVIKLAVICVAGGAICRLSALQFARNEKPGLAEALHFSTKRFTSLFAAPLIPIAIIGFLGLLIIISGLLGNIPWIGELIMAIAMPLTLIAGTLIAIIAIGSLAGFNLMPAAIAYDGSDAFDAISRSFSYVYAKPWRMGFYTILAAIYGAICYTFVRFFAFLLLLSTHQFLQLGIMVKSSSKTTGKLDAIWPQPEFLNLLFNTSRLGQTSRTESIAAFLIYLSVLVVVGLVISFIISFYFSANTIIYSLMRNRVDNTALDDVYSHLDNVDDELVQAKINKVQPEPELSSEDEAETTPDSLIEE